MAADLFRHARRPPGPVVAVALMLAGPAAAHDFWIQPQAYPVAAPANVPIVLQVGHGASLLRSPIAARRIVRLQLVAPSGAITDLREGLQRSGAGPDAVLRLQAPGPHVLLLQTDDAAQSHLPALRFNDYLRAEGLTPAVALRTREGRMAQDGAESYRRCAKLVLQAGASDGRSDATVTRVYGLALEIVPERSPYAIPRAATLPVRVFYRGRPLPGALVKMTDLAADAAPFEMRLTDGAGRAVFPLPSTGAWLLNVVWTEPQPRSAETDFETSFSSLGFGFAARPGRAAP
jgi:uncharacterized GH25 family protein